MLEAYSLRPDRKMRLCAGYRCCFGRGRRKCLVPSEDGDGGITAAFVEEGDLTLSQYIRSIGCIIHIAPDGRPLIEVKVG